VLTQIGLGYALVYVLLGRGLKVQLLAVIAVLAGYWLLFAAWPLPPAGYDYAAVKAADAKPFIGFFAHWNKNANVAYEFDLWFLNLFPRAEPFRYDSGGYQTLNFVPSMATMIFGLMAGELLRGRRSPVAKLGLLLLAAGLCLGLGLLLGYTACPIVKRIWTPSWAVYSAGWTFLMLAAFYWVIDLQGWRAWAFPLVVVGMNSITMYCMAQLSKGRVRQTLKTHFGQDLFGGFYGPVVQPLAILFVLWLVCLWLYRQRIFVRI
jgi:predicted acyltransferase